MPKNAVFEQSATCAQQLSISDWQSPVTFFRFAVTNPIFTKISLSMKKALILTFVFVLAIFAKAWSQTDNAKSAPVAKDKTEQMKKAEENSDGAAYSGKGKGGDKDMVEKEKKGKAKGKHKKGKKAKKAKKAKKNKDAETPGDEQPGDEPKPTENGESPKPEQPGDSPRPTDTPKTPKQKPAPGAIKKQTDTPKQKTGDSGKQ